MGQLEGTNTQGGQVVGGGEGGGGGGPWCGKGVGVGVCVGKVTNLGTGVGWVVWGWGKAMGWALPGHNRTGEGVVTESSVGQPNQAAARRVAGMGWQAGWGQPRAVVVVVTRVAKGKKEGSSGGMCRVRRQAEGGKACEQITNVCVGQGMCKGSTCNNNPNVCKREVQGRLCGMYKGRHVGAWEGQGVRGKVCMCSGGQGAGVRGNGKRLGMWGYGAVWGKGWGCGGEGVV